jgi:hypothetical protein
MAAQYSSEMSVRYYYTKRRCIMSDHNVASRMVYGKESRLGSRRCWVQIFAEKLYIVTEAVPPFTQSF